METYIVRIYRQDSGHPGEIVGVLKDAETEKQVSFTNLQELLELIKQSVDSKAGE